MASKYINRSKLIFQVLATFTFLLTFTVVVHADPGTSKFRLPSIKSNPVQPLRGAQLIDHNWSDLNLPNWSLLGDFPKWGGNVFRIFLTPFADGSALLPGEPLTLRLAESLKRFIQVIDWSLDHNVYVILAFNPYYNWPPPAANWPDDGRSIWKHDSAQDELVQAWADLANHFKGSKGIIFDLFNEPHGISDDEVDNDHDLPKQVWNNLYPRLIDAIRDEDPNRWILVTPIWGNMQYFTDLVVNSSPKLIYTFHFYSPHFFTHQGIGANPPAGTVSYPGITRDSIWENERYWDKSVVEEKLIPAISFKDTHQVRVMCGEYGSSSFAPPESRARWTNDILELLEHYGFDHLYFQYEGRRAADPGNWTFEATSFESLVRSVLALNLQAYPRAIVPIVNLILE